MSNPHPTVHFGEFSGTVHVEDDAGNTLASFPWSGTLPADKPKSVAELQALAWIDGYETARKEQNK